jgi:hypothetical protein
MNGPSSTGVPGATGQSGLAPIAFFVYNRPKHTQKTLDSLVRNGLASRSDLFIFSDAPRSESAAQDVQDVRQLVSGAGGFRSITITERKKNLGLANSVIDGVTQVCKKFGRVIVMEDDLLTSADFLSFMNEALERYAREPRVFSISGFNFALRPPEGYGYDAFSSYRSSSWGWGTWLDRWQKADWDVIGYETFRADRKRRQLFNRGGDDLAGMLDMQMAGQLDSWAIRWAYTHFSCAGLAMLSTSAKVYNIGLDGSGIHSSPGSVRQSKLESAVATEYRFPDSVEPDAAIAAEIYRMCRSPLPRKLIRYLFAKLRSQPVVRPKAMVAKATGAKSTLEGGL